MPEKKRRKQRAQRREAGLTLELVKQVHYECEQVLINVVRRTAQDAYPSYPDYQVLHFDDLTMSYVGATEVLRVAVKACVELTALAHGTAGTSHESKSRRLATRSATSKRYVDALYRILYLDQVWPFIRLSVRVMRDLCSWPTRLNNYLQLYPHVPGDCCYLFLGISTVDFVRASTFDLPPPSLDFGSGRQFLYEDPEDLDEDAIVRMREWFPSAFARLRKLEPPTHESLTLWDRGLLAEHDVIHHRLEVQNQSHSSSSIGHGTEQSEDPYRTYNVLEQSGLTLDVVRREVRYRGALLRMNKQSHFELVRCLYSASGHVATYTACMVAIGTHSQATSVTVTKTSPPLRDAVSSINRAFEERRVPFRLRAIQGYAYQIRSLDK